MLHTSKRLQTRLRLKWHLNHTYCRNARVKTEDYTSPMLGKVFLFSHKSMRTKNSTLVITRARDRADVMVNTWDSLRQRPTDWPVPWDRLQIRLWLASLRQAARGLTKPQVGSVSVRLSLHQRAALISGDLTPGTASSSQDWRRRWRIKPGLGGRERLSKPSWGFRAGQHSDRLSHGNAAVKTSSPQSCDLTSKT